MNFNYLLFSTIFFNVSNEKFEEKCEEEELLYSSLLSKLNNNDTVCMFIDFSILDITVCSLSQLFKNIMTMF